MEERIRWRLDPKDVGWGTSGVTVTRRRRRSRASRAVDSRDQKVTLVHKPTGIEVEGFIPEGHYSRKRMIELRRALYEKLFAGLEERVAKQLRIPGR